MNFNTEFISKKYTPSEAISLVSDHAIAFTAGEPTLLFDEIYTQRDRFSKLRIYSMMGLSNPKSAASLLGPEMENHLIFGASYLRPFEVKALKNGQRLEHLLCHLSEFENFLERRIRPEYLICNVAPMDEEGYFSMGVNAGCGRVAVDLGAKVILQVNRDMPKIHSDYYRIHISEVAALCEASIPIQLFEDPVPSEIEQKIASHIVERIPNGATIQLGVGGVPSAVALSLSEHRNLGLHTELFTNTMTMLCKNGVINNSKKTIMNGISVSGFVEGSQETYDFLNDNKSFCSKKLGWVNNPDIIAQNYKMTSINTCLSVDLRGQICSESLGTNVTGGSGGQVDFVRGAQRSEGGASYIAMRSVVEQSDGSMLSKITLSFPVGSAITTLRNDAQFVATEYGIAELKYRTAREKALALISVAHPNFREQLTFDAKKQHLI